MKISPSRRLTDRQNPEIRVLHTSAKKEEKNITYILAERRDSHRLHRSRECEESLWPKKKGLFSNDLRRVFEEVIKFRTSDDSGVYYRDEEIR